jgi:hypothetical protein
MRGRPCECELGRSFGYRSSKPHALWCSVRAACCVPPRMAFYSRRLPRCSLNNLLTHCLLTKLHAPDEGASCAKPPSIYNKGPPKQKATGPDVVDRPLAYGVKFLRLERGLGRFSSSSRTNY